MPGTQRSRRLRRGRWLRRLRRNRLYRTARASVRDTLVLTREFQVPLVLFAVTFIGGGILYRSLSLKAGLSTGSHAENAFLVLSMIFLQANAEFPDVWYLQLFFFLMPLIGLAILGRGAADFGVLLFNRQARGEAWQVAVASTYSDHIVLVGLGHLGFRVAHELHNLGEDVVAIERDPDADQYARVAALGIPIIPGDARKPEILEKAGVSRARAVLLCTNDDTTNLQMALNVKDLNARARVIVRVFDDEFARSIQSHFAIDQAFSASALAAPAFAAAAVETDIIPPVTIAGRVLSMGRFTVRPRSQLAGLPVGTLEDTYDVSVVALERDDRCDLNPVDEVVLAPNDTIGIFAERQTLNEIAQLNRADQD